MLTPFQKRLCRWRAAGLSLREISEISGRAEGTIRNDFWKIRQILGMPRSENLQYTEAGQRNSDMSHNVQDTFGAQLLANKGLPDPTS